MESQSAAPSPEAPENSMSNTHPVDGEHKPSAPPLGTSGAARSAKRPPLPEVEDLLAQLLQLNGAVMLGAISAKDASVMQKNIKTVLDVQLKRSTHGGGGPSQEALVDLCRRDPRVISAVQSFLTAEQLQLLMELIAGDGDGPV